MSRSGTNSRASSYTPPVGAQRLRRFTSAVGVVILAITLLSWESPDPLKFAGFLLVTVLSAGMRISRADGSQKGVLPLNFLFVLFGIAELSTPESIALAAAAGLTHRLWAGRDDDLQQTIFEVAHLVIGATLVERIYHFPAISDWAPPLRLFLGAFGMFLIRTLPLAGLTAMSEGEPFLRTFLNRHVWVLPYYLTGAVLAIAMAWMNIQLGWQTVLLCGPVVYLIFHCYGLYQERIDDERRHAKEVSSLHLRTIEALALAIDAKDQSTHNHLRRVQLYAAGLAEALQLEQEDREALHAAVPLHDIGKLAVPEHIVSKPGRLTPEEFEKIKIHPMVGAEILEGVQFPYPVAPIVRAHHEKWDGSGYPYGLAAENIPIGARILAVVDCLDALISDRQYRRAMPLDDALKIIQSESGKSYDPRVVDALMENYQAWERKGQSTLPPLPRKGDIVDVETAPAATAYPRKNPERDFLTTIAAARHEVQALFEIAQDLGNSLNLDETLSVLGVRLSRIIPHHALAIWIRRDGVLMPEYVNGEDMRIFSTLQIPVGHGVSGLVASNGKASLNANPAHESQYLSDPSRISVLRSAIAVPLEGAAGVLGVLTLYHTEAEAFSKDHLRILLGISTKIGVSIENVLRYRQVESSATTDFLTTLPNARSLFIQLDTELARSRREERPLAVLVLDLDGFKAVNDKLGHLEGNRLLRSVGSNLKRACREYDYVARMGGDEFVVLLPGVQAHDIDAKINQFRDVVIRSAREVVPTANVSASIGVTLFPRDGTDAEALLSEADKRMYQEKRYRKSGPGTRPFLIRGTKGQQGA